MSTTLKCRKCRQVIVRPDSTSLLNSHNVVLHEINNSVYFDCSGKIQDVWYLPETEAPEWIINCVNEGSWQKGKLICPHCKARIGSFDFISGSQCSCKTHLLPPIHLVKSKTDVC